MSVAANLHLKVRCNFCQTPWTPLHCDTARGANANQGPHPVTCLQLCGSLSPGGETSFFPNKPGLGS